MRKIIFAFIWLLSFLLLLLVCDQFLLRYPGENTPLLSDFQYFYKDVRQRVVALNPQQKEHSVQQVISQRLQQVSGTTGEHKVETGGKNAAPTQQGVHYIYLDEQQSLNFAERWEDIPPPLRHSAKKLDN